MKKKQVKQFSFQISRKRSVEEILEENKKKAGEPVMDFWNAVYKRMRQYAHFLILTGQTDTDDMKVVLRGLIAVFVLYYRNPNGYPLNTGLHPVLEDIHDMIMALVYCRAVSSGKDWMMKRPMFAIAAEEMEAMCEYVSQQDFDC